MAEIFTPYKISYPYEGKLLIHCCCAPCSGVIIELLSFSKIDFSILFYNPNIYPKEEYELRKDHLKQFANKKNIPFIELDYDKENWEKEVSGLENEPERGKRCYKCFMMRLKKTAKYANKYGYKIFATSLGISRWKDIKQINLCGEKAASEVQNVSYWPYNWRKKGASQGMYEIAKREEFYMQKYCGCIYSYQASIAKKQSNIKLSILF